MPSFFVYCMGSGSASGAAASALMRTPPGSQPSGGRSRLRRICRARAGNLNAAVAGFSFKIRPSFARELSRALGTSHASKLVFWLEAGVFTGVEIDSYPRLNVPGLSFPNPGRGVRASTRGLVLR